jgi:hypothetical protein
MKKNILLFINLFLPFIVFSQTLQSISPSSANAGQTLTVSITGKGTKFKQGSGTTVILGVNGAVTNSVTAVHDSLIQANITIPSNAFTGDYDVTVMGVTVISKVMIKAFHVNGVPAPGLKAITPGIVNSGQTLDVTITGRNTHFSTNGNNIVEFGFGQGSGTTVANSTTPVSDTLLKANITVPAKVYNGTYPVYVKNSTDGALVLQNVFQVNGNPRPELAAINPKNGIAGKNLDVTITGRFTHFSAGSNSVTFGFTAASGTTVVNSTTVLSDTTIRANISIPVSIAPGDYGVAVTNSIEGNIGIQMAFHVSGAALPPAINTNPAGILAGETANISIRGIRGTHFNQPGNKTTVNFVGNRTITVNSKTVVNDSMINLNITAPAIEGGYQVFVNDSIDGQFKGDFKIYPKCHAFFKTTYNTSTNVFTLTLDSATSKATSFHWDFGDGTASTDSFPSHVFTEDKIYNVCLQITNTAGDSCSYCHEIGKDSLGNPIFKTIGFSMYAKPYKELITGIPSNGDDAHFVSVYPNPADNLITIMSSTAISVLNKPVLSIYSIEGKLILQQAFVKEKMTLDVSAFQKGIYIMQLTGSKQTEIIKFTKE